MEGVEASPGGFTQLHLPCFTGTGVPVAVLVSLIPWLAGWQVAVGHCLPVGLLKGQVLCAHSAHAGPNPPFWRE